MPGLYEVFYAGYIFLRLITLAIVVYCVLVGNAYVDKLLRAALVQFRSIAGAHFQPVQGGEELHCCHQAIAGRVVIEKNQVTTLLAADGKALGAHLLQNVTVANLGLNDFDAVCRHAADKA